MIWNKQNILTHFHAHVENALDDSQSSRLDMLPFCFVQNKLKKNYTSTDYFYDAKEENKSF